MVLACKMCPKQVEASFYAFVLAVINLGYLVSYQFGGLLTYSLGITATNFSNLWILVLLSALFPLATQVFLLFLPEKYDVNEEISKYFQSKRRQREHKESAAVDENERIDVDQRSTGSIRFKANIRDEIEVEELLVDRECESKNEE